MVLLSESSAALVCYRSLNNTHHPQFLSNTLFYWRPHRHHVDKDTAPFSLFVALSAHYTVRSFQVP